MRFFHTDDVGIHDYVISPLYGVSAEHAPGLWLGLIGLIIGYFTLREPNSTVFRWTVALLTATGAAHLGLAVGHEPGLRTVLFVGYGVASLYLARVARVQGHLHRAVPWLVTGSIVAFLVVSFGGESPDQVGVIVKVAEIGLLSLVLKKKSASGRVAALKQSSAVVGLTVLMALGAWAGAWQGGGHDHSLGASPAPGLAIPDLEPREPTGAERAAADRLYEETVTALAEFEDVTVAAAAGYQVEGMSGLDGHADNPSLQNDGKILDPSAPETLVYAEGPDGPVLLGAMFQMDGIGKRGPAVGGPLTVWHAHDHICFGVLPPSLTSFGSPVGMCPLGTVTVAISNEMIHVWTIDGAPDRFGDLEDEWIRQTLFGQDEM